MREESITTFEQIPKAISQLIFEVNIVKQLLIDRNEIPKPDPDRWFSIDELCTYLPGKPSKNTIYGKVHKREIPHKKFGKRLLFLKSEIDWYLQSLNRKTAVEIEAEADAFIKNQNKKG